MGVSVTTRKTLWGRAHNECAFPTCLQELTFDSETSDTAAAGVRIIGEEAHIRAQRAGGPRYDAGYADVDGYDNLMLMCPTHHAMIDANNGADYSVKSLEKMKAEHERKQKRRGELQGALRAYLGDRFAAENTVQFQQAELRGPSVEAMFVDVPVGGRRDGSALADLLAHISAEAPGDTEELERSSGLLITGATQALLHPNWTGNAILVGGPGQGKSTVLQYVCQFHRARRLGEEGYSAGQSELTRAESPARFPIRIDLRRYAQWAEQLRLKSGKRQKKQRQSPQEEDRWSSLEEYVVDHIRRNIGMHKFAPEDLALLLATEPVLFALDGLDEVANLATRSRVVEEISRMRGRLRADAADLVILVATRPGAALRPLTASGAFPVLHLQRLTQGLRLQYLRQWVEVLQLSEESAEKLQSTFMDSQHVPHVSELASYPMQLAILLHLLHRRQLLPQQRTELYAEYLKTFLDREQTEDKEPLLKDQRRVVEDTHAYLGWYLQTKAEEEGSAGSITRDELRALLRAYLAGQPEEQQLADDLYSAITDRVLCLVEREDAFEFEVQSLREYFAALHLYENLTPKGIGNSRDDGLNALLERPYWANTCRFFIGMLAKGELRALIGNFFTVEKKVTPRPLVRSMAVTLLNDRVYDGLTSDEIQGVVDFVLSGPGLLLAEDGVLDAAGNPLRFGERAGRAQAIAHLKTRLEQDPDAEARQAAATSLLAHSLPTDDLAAWWWEQFTPTPLWVETAARLRVFAPLSVQQEARLHTVLSSYNEPGQWRADLLRQGGYSGHSTDAVQLVWEDLNAGCDTDPDGPSRDLNALIACASSILAGSQTVPLIASEENSQAQSPLAVRVCEAARSLRPVSTASAAVEWDQYLSVVAEAWGPGWVLGRAVARVPETIDVSLMSARAGSPALTAAARIEADYRGHRSDPDWWRDRLSSVGDGYDLMLAVIALVEQARTATIVAVAAELDAAVRRLDLKQFRAVERALQQDAASYRVQPLDLHEPLRLHRVSLSGRVLWLIWQLATESTRERIPTYLEKELADVFLAGPTDGRPVVAAARTSRKVKLDCFRHARPSLPGGGWADPTQLATITIGLAKEVLETPGAWPMELVQIAIDRLNAQAASRVTPLSDVASANHWFGSP
ncbi:NACHT domain-containing protein [Leucobacter sp. Z1108]|uniref:NACHT domain-containing protein n=1 Tax=Leucobacter sp. Z1108 TaxID=3439066 RepID=UPI003F4FCE09